MSIKERKFSEKSTLISVTDVKGVIQYCNSDFIEISGFTEGELLNSHHNIVRHPDMPKAAFEDLWATIQKDKPWQGMVKNKCKNGDYYWVHAYVTPIFEKGVKTGYQSVRSCPTQQQISDAELLYNSLNSNPAKKLPKPPFLKRIKLAAKINIILLMLTSLFLYEQISAKQFFTIDPEYLVFNLGFVILVGLLVYMVNVEVVKRVNALTKTLRTISSGDLNENIEVDKFDEIGSTIMSSKMLQGRLKAIIGRFTESTQSLGLAIDVLSESGYQTKVNMDKQHLETEMVATAMNEMSATVTEIAQNTTRTSDYSATANNMATTGKETVESTKNTVLELATDVQAAANTINELAVECAKIKDITSAISDIADQTNLLALNAAIEAARAGEYGRGFSVVADEVRNLSSRTQASTLEINTMIESLQNKSKDSVLAMEHGLEKVNYSVEKIQSTEDAFNQIVDSVTDVNDMNMQIATAAEEQTCVTEEMNSNVHSINSQSQKTIENVLTLEEKISSLKDLLSSLELQLEQYDLGESASQFDFNAAKNAHLAWKSKVRDFLGGDLNAITKEQICSHRECMLGKWYYTEGKKSYGHSKYFQQIEPPHARLHQIVKEVYELHEVGELDKANDLYKELGPLSDNIVSLLDKTKLSVS
jgi:aerotaxis receptor